MTQDQAQIVALKALGWMGAQEGVLDLMLGASGMDLETLKGTAGTAETQLAVVEFLLSNESWVRDFCSDEGYPPETMLLARQALPGGSEMHWT